MNTNLPIWKKTLFYSVTYLIVFAFLNGVAWLISPKDSVFWQNPLMAMYPTKTFDEKVTMEQLNLNNDPKRSVRYVRDNKRWYRLEPEPDTPKEGKLILNFGDSSTWGWGLPDRKNAYPSVLGEFLPASIHSLNLGVPSYSSLNGLLHVWELVPKYHERILAVTLYFGNNDGVANGVADADKVRHESTRSVRAVRWFPLGRVSHDAIWRILAKSNQEPRVSPEAYRSNLQEAIRFVRSYDIPVILIEPPRHLSWPAGALRHTVSLRPQVSNKWVLGKLDSATATYRKGLSYMYERNDACTEYFREALDHDWVIPRLKTSWLKVLREVSRSEQVALVSLDEPFVESEFPYCFEDYCHPSTQVHAQIAARIRQLLPPHE